MSDPLGRTTSHLTEVIEEVEKLIDMLHGLRPEGKEKKNRPENVALDLVIQGAYLEMENYKQEFKESN